MASKFSLIFLILSVWAVDDAFCGSVPAPSPAVDCSTLILDMAECLSFVTNGSTVTKPEAACCSGLKTVLKTDAECLCEAFKSSAQLGVSLNVSKALTLPAACKVATPPAAKCDLSLSPAGAPGISPSSSVAAPPTMTEVVNEEAPAPAPGIPGSGSSILSISVGSIAIGVLIALFSVY